MPSPSRHPAHSARTPRLSRSSKTYAMGIVTTSDQTKHIFVDYYAPTNLNTSIATGGNIPGNIVQVSVQNVSWRGSRRSAAPRRGQPYSDYTVVFSAYSSDILGGYPAGVNS